MQRQTEAIAAQAKYFGFLAAAVVEDDKGAVTHHFRAS